MKRSLLLKLISAYIVFVLLTLVILSTFIQHITTERQKQHEAQNLYREATLIASDYASLYYRDSFSPEELHRQISAISKYLSAEIWIISPNGNIVVDSSNLSVSQSAIQGTFKSITEFDVADFGSSYYLTGNFYNSFDQDTLTVFYPITMNYQVRGYVLLHKSTALITNTANEFTNIAFYAAGITLTGSLLLLLFFLFTVYRPLRKISKISMAYAKGEFTQKISVHSSDEFGVLADTMNFMATELDTLEEDQRKFVSNVSHDFRSPLTSIKGYVEAILDGTIPAEMQDKYLNIILSETERLNNLTQSLLDLNRFGQHGVRLDIADFDINQMIRTTVATFEGRCLTKRIRFELFLTGEELYVTADMSKIQQVIHNLIDNAIKFSYTNSSIKIETSIMNEKTILSIRDSGIGIPADSIKKIWERFYKTDLSRGKDKKGTGLGLAIVKEIIQAHNEHIDVISTEGAGSEFIFTLPLSQREL